MEHRSPGRRRLARVLLVAAVAACGADGDEAGDVQSAAEAFAFGEDDLCVWITADDVAEFVASAYDWEGTAELADRTDAGPDECWWTLTGAGGEHHEVFAGNAADGVLLPVEDVDDDDGGTVGAPGGAVSGHPALGEGVVVQSAGWGVYSFWVPPREDSLALSLTHTTGSVVTGVDSSPDEQARIDAQARLFALADRFLRELGWVS